MPETPAKAIVRRYFDEVLNQGKLDRLDELCTPSAQHRAGWGKTLNLEEFRAAAAQLLTLFPGTQYTVEELIGEDDKVVARWTYRARHEGEFMGVPGTGKLVVTHGVNIFRIQAGRIQDSWEVWDRLGFQQQLRAEAAPEHPVD